MTMPAITAATRPGPIEPASGGQSFEGRVIEICDEPPAHGALGIVWISIVPESSSLMDVRGLVVWPGTAIAVSGGDGACPGEADTPKRGDRVRARASCEEYWSIPPIYDASRIELVRC